MKNCSVESSSILNQENRYECMDNITLMGSQIEKESLRIIGTPDYIAPEILLYNQSDHKCLDWWAVGIILFEMLIGIPPFNDDTVDKIFHKICQNKIPWDEIEIGYEEDQISPLAFDLINKLLESDDQKRLGCNGAQEIKTH